MAGKKRKILGIVVLFVAFLIASLGSLAITSTSILDTDPGTYIIVVILMLFLFILFLAKEDLEFKFRKKSIVVGVIVFVVYLIVLSYLRVALSFDFLSYRIDAFLFPLLLLSLIIIIFGIESLEKLYPVLVYALFASPLLLLPFLGLNSAFANLNAALVYGIIKLLGASASRAGLVISSAAGSSITVSSTCVSLGIFVAFVMFLIPIAYLYDGKTKKKIYWIISGIALILVLNLLRMLLVAIVWVYYGLNSAIGLFHSFAGQLIFYIAIVAMVLLTYKYEMRMKPAKKTTGKEIKTFYKNIAPEIIAIIGFVLVLAIVALFFNLGYTNSVNAPATLFGTGNGISAFTLDQYALKNLEYANSNILILGNSSDGNLFSLSSTPGEANQTVFVLVNSSSGSTQPSNSLISLPHGITHHYLLRNGITVTTTVVSSGNLTFDLNYFAIPYNTSSGWIALRYLLFQQVQQNSLPYCNLSKNNYSLNIYIENRIYDAISLEDSSTEGLMCQAYRIAGSA